MYPRRDRKHSNFSASPFLSETNEKKRKFLQHEQQGARSADNSSSYSRQPFGLFEYWGENRLRRSRSLVHPGEDRSIDRLRDKPWIVVQRNAIRCATEGDD